MLHVTISFGICGFQLEAFKLPLRARPCRIQPLLVGRNLRISDVLGFLLVC